jgi:hypothetical protein
MQETSIDGTLRTTIGPKPSEARVPSDPMATEAPRVYAPPGEQPAALPAKPRRVARAKGFVLDILFATGVFVFGGTLAVYGMRKATILRVFVELTLVAAFVAAGYFALGWFAPETMRGWSFGDPLHRAAGLLALAFSLSYVGGTVAYWGWRYSGDARVGMLVLALGTAVMGGRVAALGMAFGELRVSEARVYTAEAAIKSFRSSVTIMKENGIDPAPLAGVVKDFETVVYGPDFATGLSAAWKYRSVGANPSFAIDAIDEPLAPVKAEKTVRTSPDGKAPADDTTVTDRGNVATEAKP